MKRVTRGTKECMLSLCNRACLDVKNGLGIDGALLESNKYKDYDASFVYSETAISVYVGFQSKSGVPIVEKSLCLHDKYEDVYNSILKLFKSECWSDNSGVFHVGSSLFSSCTDVRSDTVVLEPSGDIAVFSYDGCYYLGISASKYFDIYVHPTKYEEFKKLFEVSGSSMIRISTYKCKTERKLMSINILDMFKNTK